MFLVLSASETVSLLSRELTHSFQGKPADGPRLALVPYLLPNSAPLDSLDHVQSFPGPAARPPEKARLTADLRKDTQRALNRGTTPKRVAQLTESHLYPHGDAREPQPSRLSLDGATSAFLPGSPRPASFRSFIEDEPPASEIASVAASPSTRSSSVDSGADANNAANAAAASVQQGPADLSGSGGVRQEAPTANFKEAVKNPEVAHALLDKFMYHLRDVTVLRAEQIRLNAGDLTLKSHRASFATNMKRVCDRLQPRYVEPTSPVRSWLSRVFHRLGGVFSPIKKQAAVVRSKILRWMRTERARAEKKPPSKAYKFLKNLATRAWTQTVRLTNQIVAQIMRMLPLVSTVLNVVFLGLAISSVVVTPTPFAILSLVALVLNIMSWAFSTGSSIHSVAVTRVIAGGSESQQIELFGLLWADLKAEEDSADFAQVPGGEPSGKEETPPDSAAEDAEALKLSQQLNIDNVEEFEIVQPPSTAEMLREVRAQMHSNLLANKAAEERRRLKKGISEAWRSRRWRAVGKILGSSLRLLLEYANHAVKEVLALFGSAWYWVVVSLFKNFVSLQLSPMLVLVFGIPAKSGFGVRSNSLLPICTPGGSDLRRSTK